MAEKGGFIRCDDCELSRQNAREDHNDMWRAINNKVSWPIFVPLLLLLLGWLWTLRAEYTKTLVDVQQTQIQISDKISATVLEATRTMNEIDKRALDNQTRITYNYDNIERLRNRCGD